MNANNASPATVRPPTRLHFALVAGVALYLMALGLHAEWFVRMSADWEPENAQVTVSEWRERTSAWRRESEAVFAYRFLRDGRLYESDRYSYRSRRHEGVAQHARGDMITAWVNPADPTQSVIARDLKWWDRLYAPFGALLLLATLLKWRSVAKASTAKG